MDYATYHLLGEPETTIEGRLCPKKDWLVLSDEQMSQGWQSSLLNNEQMSIWLGVEHQPVVFGSYITKRSEFSVGNSTHKMEEMIH